jgi:hypothetical protein
MNMLQNSGATGEIRSIYIYMICYTQEEFDNSNSKDLLLLKCNFCEENFKRSKKELWKFFKNQNYGSYCSQGCKNQHRTFLGKKEVECTECNKKFSKHHSQIKKSIGKNFCSKSCAATYNNTHKKYGTRRCKLEIWLQEQLTNLYSNLIILYNSKQIIKSEVDIYIPSLKLAIEINGIYHYKPIHGQYKLNQIHNNDNKKIQSCLEKEIELVIIDTSKLTYNKPEKYRKYLDIITNIINSK